MRGPFFRLAIALIGMIGGVVLNTASAVAQHFDVGGDFLVGLPQNAFRDKVNEVGYGFSGHFGYFLGNSPLMIGVDLGYLNYGTETRRESFSDTIPDVTVDVRTRNNILMLHGFARVQPQQGPVRPYAEGLWGFKYLFTRTSIEDDYFDEPIASSTNFDDFAESWGLGTGVDLQIWKPKKRQRSGGIVDVSLNISAQYLWGSEAEYLKKGSIYRDSDGDLSFLVLRSKTDMLVPRFGIRVRF